MDVRIQDEVNQTWDGVFDYEYSIVEGIHQSLGNNGCRLVDIGCGSNGLLGRNRQRLVALQPRSLGIDMDEKALASNSAIAHRICASCYSLPLQSNSVDIIVCRWTFEHLETPELAMREFARVLKKGGALYIKTSNLWNYTMMVSRATPTVVHNLFLTATGQRKNTETFYRANTKRKLVKLATASGFAVRRLETYPYSYMYYSFHQKCFLTMRSISKLVGRITPNMHLMLCCVLEKL